MADQQLYRYWVLRYVPDVVRGEFVNIGVIVGAPGVDWALRTVSSTSHLRRLGGYPDVARDWLRELDRMIFRTDSSVIESPGRQPSVEFIERIRAQQNNLVQVAQAVPVRAANAAAAADLLFASLVADGEAMDKSSARKHAKLRLRADFEGSSTIGAGDLRRDVVLHAGRQAASFDFAVGGDHVVQISQVWSFVRQDTQNLRQTISASSFAVRTLRDRGGAIRSRRGGSNTLELASDVPVRVVYVPPESPAQRDVFEMASEGWEGLGIRAYPAGEEAAVVAEAERLLRTA